MMTCSRILTKRVLPTLQRKAFQAPLVACNEFSALVSIEDEFPGYANAIKNCTDILSPVRLPCLFQLLSFVVFSSNGSTAI